MLPSLGPKEMGAGIAASPHCAERRICRCSVYLVPPRKRLGPRFSILAHQLRRRFPPNRSLFRGARSIYSTARPEGSLVFRPFRPGFWNRSPSKPKQPSVPRPFLGRPLSRPASLTSDPKTFGSRVALEDGQHIRRLFPAGREEPEGSSHSCRRRSDLWSPAAPFLPFPALQVRPGPPSRSPGHNAQLFRVGEAKISPFGLWITGISGTIAGTFPDSPNRRRIGCRSVPLRLLRLGA